LLADWRYELFQPGRHSAISPDAECAQHEARDCRQAGEEVGTAQIARPAKVAIDLAVGMVSLKTHRLLLGKLLHLFPLRPIDRRRMIRPGCSGVTEIAEEA
jgi:hypothetical protein